MLLVSLVAQPLIMHIQAKFRPLLNVFMAYDGKYRGLNRSRQKYKIIYWRAGPSRGHHLKVSKTKVWWPTMSPDLLENLDRNVLCNRNGPVAEVLTLLGAAFGSHSHIRSHFSKLVSKTESILLSLKDLADPQIAFRLQRYCASTCLVSRLL